jgi:hypothetical protein
MLSGLLLSLHRHGNRPQHRAVEVLASQDVSYV